MAEVGERIMEGEMTKEDEKFFKAVISLQGNPNFEIVREKIKRTYSTVCFNWYRQQPDQYARFAGQAQALANVISEIDAGRAYSELDAAIKAAEKPPGSSL